MAPAPTSTITSLISTATNTLPATLAATASATSKAVTNSGGSKMWYETPAFIYSMVAVGMVLFVLGGLVFIALLRGTPDAPVHQPAKSGKIKWYRWVWGFNKEDYPSTVPQDRRH
ncbi:hypothetical protein HDU96_001635 [Phlyctochytrium bullatum]|nr:hypothetical protein HDU96_001635 [Phlyctochytrium bullatum]